MTKSTSIVFILLFALLFRLESKVMFKKFLLGFTEKIRTNFYVFIFSRGLYLLSFL